MTTPSRRASCSVALMLCRTARSAQSELRLRVSARLRMKATASLVTFSFISSDMDCSPPWSPKATGWAEPMLVLGAMAATCAA